MTAYATKESMEETLTRTFELVQTDETFPEGTKKAHFSISLEIDDLDPITSSRLTIAR
jgi:hypothetical protein